MSDPLHTAAEDAIAKRDAFVAECMAAKSCGLDELARRERYIHMLFHGAELARKLRDAERAIFELAAFCATSNLLHVGQTGVNYAENAIDSLHDLNDDARRELGL